MIRPILNKTPYELFKGQKPNIKHLRVFGRKCYVHNNGKESLGKFDPRSDEAIFLRYSSYSKTYKLFNKRTLCVEASVHALFNETNSLIEHDTQEKELELGLVRKDFSLTQISMVDNGKAPEGETSPESDSVESGQGANQSGGSIAEPDLEQNRPTQPTPSQTDVGTGSRTDLEPISSSIQGRLENISVDPFIP